MAADRAAALRALIAVAVFVVVLKEIDGLPRMLARVGVILSERADILSHSIEELSEMALPVLVMTVLLQLARSTAAAPATLTLPPCDARA